jgi:hypothetical protein
MQTIPSKNVQSQTCKAVVGLRLQRVGGRSSPRGRPPTPRPVMSSRSVAPSTRASSERSGSEGTLQPRRSTRMTSRTRDPRQLRLHPATAATVRDWQVVDDGTEIGLLSPSPHARGQPRRVELVYDPETSPIARRPPPAAPSSDPPPPSPGERPTTRRTNPAGIGQILDVR